MTLIPSLTTWNDGDVLPASDLNANFAALRNTLNESGAFTDVVRTWTAAQTFNAGITVVGGAFSGTTTAETVSASVRLKLSANAAFEAGSLSRSATLGLVFGGYNGSSYQGALCASDGSVMAAIGNSGVAGETGLLLYDIATGTVRRVKKKAGNTLGASDDVLVLG